MGSTQDVPCYSAALYGIVSKRQDSLHWQCIRAVHVAQLAGPPNLLQLSHSFVARLCRISRLHMTVSTAKLIKRVLQEPVAFRGCSFASSCSDMIRYDRYARYGFYPYLRILGFYSHADKVFIEEQISQEGLHCPDTACCVVCSAFVEVEPLLARHQRKESGDVV